MDHLQYTATMLGSSGHSDAFNMPPHRRGAVLQWFSFNTVPRCLGAVGSGTPSVLRHGAWEQWATGLLRFMAMMLGSSGQRDSFSILPHCPIAVGNGSPSIHCPIAGEQWAVALLYHTAALLGSSG